MTGCSRFGLTSREGDVARLLMRGQPNKEIADHLALELQTIKNRVSVVLLKTGSRNRTECALRLTEASAPL